MQKVYMLNVVDKFKDSAISEIPMELRQDIDPSALNYHPYIGWIATGNVYHTWFGDCPGGCEEGYIEVLRSGEPPDGFTEMVECDHHNCEYGLVPIEVELETGAICEV